ASVSASSAIPYANGTPLGSAGQLGLGQERDEALGLEQVPLRTAVDEPELGEDRDRVGIAIFLAPLRLEPFPLGDVAFVGLEHMTHVELRRDRPVPLVRLELECDIEETGPAQAFEPSAEPERDRTPRVAPVRAHAELQVLALADGGQVDQLAAREQQRHVRVAEAERREPRQLVAKLERQLGAMDERVD